MLSKVLCISKDSAQGENQRRGGKGKEKEYFRIIKSKFPYILHPRREFHDFKADGEELQKNQYKTQSTTMQNVLFEGKNTTLTDVLLDTKLHFTAWQLHNCFQHSVAPSRARLTSAEPPLQSKTLTDKSMLLPTEQT